MTSTTISGFLRRFSAFRQHARSQPVKITRHGQRLLVLISAEHYDWMRVAARRTHRTSDAVAVVIDEAEWAEMDFEGLLARNVNLQYQTEHHAEAARQAWRRT
jgi:PHD/YefM family antitoxin component YafN of YafNO toxin-antitoxin module